MFRRDIGVVDRALEAQLPWLEISVFLLSIIFLFAAFKVVVHDDDGEESPHFKVPVPEQCSPEWKGEILEKPTVKVPPPFYMAVELTSVTDLGIQRHKMLLPSQWPTTRTREPCHA